MTGIRRPGILAGTAVLIVGVTAIGIGLRPEPAGQPLGAAVRVGGLSVSTAYVVEPASPEVAAGYLKVTNDGGSADVLTSVTSDSSPTVSLHAVQTSGSVARMVDVKSLEVPPHGQLILVPGRDHLMLEKPTQPLVAGDVVHLRLTFAHSGSVTFEVPVVSQADASRIAAADAPTRGGRQP